MSGDISIGAVGAALIAGVVSLLGLIISKEQKTSEFRQAWVDALRSEITAYLTSFNAIADAVGVTYKDQAEKVKALAPLYSQLNQASFAITLRVNPDENRSKAVLACMKRFQQLTADDSIWRLPTLDQSNLTSLTRLRNSSNTNGCELREVS